MKVGKFQFARGIVSALFAFIGLVIAPVSGAAQQGSGETRESKSEQSSELDDRGIDISIKGGRREKQLPMAIPKTLAATKSVEDIATKVHRALRKDMKVSGFFKVLTEDNFFFDPSKEGMADQAIEFENWAETGARALVKTEVSLRNSNVVIDFRLYLVDEKKRAHLGWTEEVVEDSDKLVARVHAFANKVVEYYTGTPGVFGSKIAFVRPTSKGNKQIFTTGMNGMNQKQLTDHPSINLLPEWGADRLYFSSYRGKNPDLWYYEDGEVAQLSSRRGQNTGAAYCGGKLAMTLSRGGENADIYLLDRESGKIQRRLTEHWAIDTSPTWNSDCSKIAFVSGRSGQAQIYVMDVESSDSKSKNKSESKDSDDNGPRRITFEGRYNTQPDWSPVEDLIVFTARDERSSFDIFLTDLEGNIRRLTQNQGNNEHPSFSPDGRYVVFTSDRGGRNRIWLMTSDGEFQTPITKGPRDSSPAWEN